MEKRQAFLKVRFSHLLFAAFAAIVSQEKALGWSHHYLITRKYLESHYPQFSTIVVPVQQLSREVIELTPHYDPLKNGIKADAPCSNPPESMEQKGLNPDLCPRIQKLLTPGESATLSEILSTFSDEPDWGMDRDGKGGILKTLMGGAQGVKHLYYPFPFLMVPFIVFPQGEAPDRAQMFFNIAQRSFRECRIYEGARMLARAIHYVEDIAQPMHTEQTWWRFIKLASPVKGTERVTKNFHSAYEVTVMYRMFREMSGIDESMLSSAFEYAPKQIYRNIASMVRIKARTSHKLAHSLYALVWKVFPEKLRKAQKVKLTYSDVLKILRSPEINRVFEVTGKALQNIDLSFMIETSGILEALEKCK